MPPRVSSSVERGQSATFSGSRGATRELEADLLAFALRALRQIAAQEIERRVGGELADQISSAHREAALFARDASVARDAEPHETDRFLARPAVRSGDARHRHRKARA